MLYRNSILEDSGDYQAALDHLNQIKNSVVDETSFNEIKARLLLSLKRYDKAERAYLVLLEGNMDNMDYLHGIEDSRRLFGGFLYLRFDFSSNIFYTFSYNT